MQLILNKLFDSSSSNDIRSLDSLSEAINAITSAEREKEEQSIAAAVALARKSKELLDGKALDVEGCIMTMTSPFSTPVIIAAIRALFDHSNAKNYDAGLDRCVNLLTHVFNENKIHAPHCMYVPDLFFPMARTLVGYLSKKEGLENKETEAFNFAKLMMLANNPNNRSVSSLHGAFLQLADVTENIEVAVPYIHTSLHSLVNELPPSANEGTEFNNRRTRSTSPPYFEPKYLVQYLFYSASILVKQKDYFQAMLFLEACMTVPGSNSLALQSDALKKYYFVSLITKGRVVLPQNRSTALTRSWKTKNKSIQQAYTDLALAGESKRNKVDNVQKVLTAHSKELEKEATLSQELIQKLRHNTVMDIVKSHSSITISSLARRCGCSDTEAEAILTELVQSGRIVANLDLEAKVAYLSGERNAASNDLMEHINKVESLQSELERLDIVAQMNPVLLVRSLKNSSLAFLQDDEGLSMTHSPMDL